MTRDEAINELKCAIDLIKQDGKDWLDERDIPLLQMAIEALERKKGKWIEYKCSICGFEPYNPSGLETFNYCSNCGAKMEKKDD